MILSLKRKATLLQYNRSLEENTKKFKYITMLQAWMFLPSADATWVLNLFRLRPCIVMPGCPRATALGRGNMQNHMWLPSARWISFLRNGGGPVRRCHLLWLRFLCRAVRLWKVGGHVSRHRTFLLEDRRKSCLFDSKIGGNHANSKRPTF